MNDVLFDGWESILAYVALIVLLRTYGVNLSNTIMQTLSEKSGIRIEVEIINS